MVIIRVIVVVTVEAARLSSGSSGTGEPVGIAVDSVEGFVEVLLPVCVVEIFVEDFVLDFVAELDFEVVSSPVSSVGFSIFSKPPPLLPDQTLGPGIW